MNIKDVASKYSEKGFSVIPISSNKIPTIKGWREFQERPMTKDEVEMYFKDDTYGMALIMGTEKSLYTIDIDLKYDLSGDIFKRFLEDIPKKILNKLYIQKTVSGGYHLIFKCPYIKEGNLKLACRFTTADEKHRTYMEAFENPLTKDKALKIASNDTSRVLFETRGFGGYICMNPTPGYKKVKGKVFNELSLKEYFELLDSARYFNEINKVSRKDSRQECKNDNWEVTPFKDYNERGDVLHILSINGWTEVHSSRSNIRLKRPGKSSASSAIFNNETRIFSVFSTSTSFDNNRGYTPSDVFIHLECNDDVGVAYNKLVEMGYGVKKQTLTQKV